MQQQGYTRLTKAQNHSHIKATGWIWITLPEYSSMLLHLKVEWGGWAQLLATTLLCSFLYLSHEIWSVGIIICMWVCSLWFFSVVHLSMPTLVGLFCYVEVQSSWELLSMPLCRLSWCWGSLVPRPYFTTQGKLVWWTAYSIFVPCCCKNCDVTLVGM